MALSISVCDQRLGGPLQQALQALRNAGCSKANTLYILTPEELAARGLSLHQLKVLASTPVGSAAAVAVGGEAPPPVRLVMRLLEDKGSRDLAFKLGVDLLP